MKRKRTRSLYLGRSLLDEIKRSSVRQRRTMSQQICLLADLALASSYVSMKTEDGFVDDTKGRVYVYMEPSLDRRVMEAKARMGEEVSYSSCIRALVMAGAALQRRDGCYMCSGRRLNERTRLEG